MNINTIGAVLIVANSLCLVVITWYIFKVKDIVDVLLSAMYFQSKGKHVPFVVEDDGSMTIKLPPHDS